MDIKIARLVAVVPDIADNTLRVTFKTDKGEVPTLALPEALVGALVAGLKSQVAVLAPGHESAQAMTLNSAELFHSSSGEIGVNLMVENGLARLPLLIPKNAVSALRGLVDALEVLGTKTSSNKLSGN